MTWQAGRVAPDRAPEQTTKMQTGKQHFFPKKSRAGHHLFARRNAFSTCWTRTFSASRMTPITSNRKVSPGFSKREIQTLADRLSSRRARFYLNEGDCPARVTLVTGRNEIDIPVAISKPTLSDAPPVHLEPAGGERLAALAHRLACLRHKRERSTVTH